MVTACLYSCSRGKSNDCSICQPSYFCWKATTVHMRVASWTAKSTLRVAQSNWTTMVARSAGEKALNWVRAARACAALRSQEHQGAAYDGESAMRDSWSKSLIEST